LAIDNSSLAQDLCLFKTEMHQNIPVGYSQKPAKGRRCAPQGWKQAGNKAGKHLHSIQQSCFQ
jgi:hypothetical protein